MKEAIKVTYRDNNQEVKSIKLPCEEWELEGIKASDIIEIESKFKGVFLVDNSIKVLNYAADALVGKSEDEFLLFEALGRYLLVDGYKLSGEWYNLNYKVYDSIEEAKKEGLTDTTYAIGEYIVKIIGE